MLTLIWAGFAPARAQEVRFTLTRVAKLAFPTSAAFTPDGSTLYVAEREGRVRVIREGKVQRSPFVTVETTTGGEGGLLGLAVDPRFDRGEPWIYLFFTLPDASADRVIRVRVAGDRAGTQQVLMSELPSGGAYHHGGIIAFGPDDKLYVTHGESHQRERAQDPRALGGKIYRIDRDGSIPADNPFEGTPTWSYGHRNPFGLAFDPKTGRAWSSENGPENHDEVNLIVKGGNYGWPIVRGDEQRSGMRPAKVDYDEILVPTGLAFAPETFAGPAADALYLGTYGEGAIHQLRLNGDRTDVVADRIIERDVNVTAMVRGPDAIYVSTPGALMRLRTDPAAASASPTPTAASPTPTATGSVSPSPSPVERDASTEAVGFIVITLAALAGYQVARWLRRARRPRPPGPWLGGRDAAPPR